jgi:hypothetical protein
MTAENPISAFDSLVGRALAAVLREILDGAEPQSGLLLNAGDAGLVRSLDRLTAAQASAIVHNGKSSIAAHVDHLRYGLELLNRWSEGDDPFGTADWSASWRRTTVSEGEWESLRTHLRREAERWQRGAQRLILAGETEAAVVLASVAHLSYHLGAIRQIDGAARGPAEPG